MTGAERTARAQQATWALKHQDGLRPHYSRCAVVMVNLRDCLIAPCHIPRTSAHEPTSPTQNRLSITASLRTTLDARVQAVVFVRDENRLKPGIVGSSSSSPDSLRNQQQKSAIDGRHAATAAIKQQSLSLNLLFALLLRGSKQYLLYIHENCHCTRCVLESMNSVPCCLSDRNARLPRGARRACCSYI